MNKPFLLVALCLPVSFAGGALVQEGTRPERDLSKITPQEKLELQVKHMAIGAPSEEHARLARYAGDFDQVAKFWLSPGAEPMTVELACTNRMVLGGRYLECRTTGEIMGMQLEAVKLVGFDRRSGELTLTSVDNMTTHPLSARGEWTEPGKVAVLAGENYDAVAEITLRFDFVLTFVDDDTLIWAMDFKDSLHSPDGTPARVVEVTSKRKK